MLGFIDSFQFPISSLDRLVKNLDEDDFKYLSQEFENNILNLVTQKRFYPYEHKSPFEKFKKKFTVWKTSKYRFFCGLYFPAFWLNMERYPISLHFQPECRKIRTRKNFVFGHFSRSDYLAIKSSIVF